MRWTKGERSEDIEDRRDEDPGSPVSGGGGGGGGFGGGMPTRLGAGTIVVLIVLSLAFKQNFFALVGGGGGAVATPSASPGYPATPQHHPLPPGTPSRSRSADEEHMVDFVSFVIDDIQATWTRELPRNGAPYHHAKLVLFRNATSSGCGHAQSAMGPFYCPADEKVYIDLAFYQELKSRFGAPGEFAQAYVIAHEVGHHVQNLLGIDAKVRRAQQARPAEANALSVKMELQADCLAGIWARSTDQRKLLEAGDIESAMGAAAAVGDDRLQKQATGRVHPESWTHGSSEQRVSWFKKGFAAGTVDACNTFDAP